MEEAEKLRCGYNFTKLEGKFPVTYECTTCYLSVTKVVYRVMLSYEATSAEVTNHVFMGD